MQSSSAARQLHLDLPSQEAYGIHDFMPAASNEIALAAVQSWPNWPQTRLLIIDGPEGAGKTHLARIWQAKAQAAWIDAGGLLPNPELKNNLWQQLDGFDHAVLDDANLAGDEPLLHLYNMIRERGGSLLLTATLPLAAWLPRLPDLSSRLLTAWTVHISAPEDELLSALLMKQFADRQLHVEPGVVAYLSRHMERSFAFARKLAMRCDQACWQFQRPLTLPLAREVLRQAMDQREIVTPDT